MDGFEWHSLNLMLNVWVQGNETRMGKGKGTFEFWATRCVALYMFMECSGADL
jgi:ribosomal protein L16/L10AE